MLSLSKATRVRPQSKKFAAAKREKPNQKACCGKRKRKTTYLRMNTSNREAYHAKAM